MITIKKGDRVIGIRTDTWINKYDLGTVVKVDDSVYTVMPYLVKLDKKPHELWLYTEDIKVYSPILKISSWLYRFLFTGIW